MFALSSRGLYHSVMKEQQQKIICDKETVGNSRHEIPLN